MTTKVSLIADNAVTGIGISNLTITADDIANNAVTTDKINFGAALVPLGGIIMWSGVTAPSGYQLCNNSELPSNSPLRPTITNTPNLQDKFIVGATSGGDGVYPGVGVNQTGGSADATLVSHIHSGTTGKESANHTHGYSYANGGDSGYELEQKGGLDGASLKTYNDGTTGTQSANHTHNFTTSDALNASATAFIGASATNANLPPYYALAFIMRVL